MFYIVRKNYNRYNLGHNLSVWNYVEKQFCLDYDAAYDKIDGFGYSTETYATKIKNKLSQLDVGFYNYYVVDRRELFRYLDVEDWRNP